MKQPVTRQTRVRKWTAVAVVALGAVAGTSIGLSLPIAQAEPKKFQLVEATIEDVHAEYKAGRLTARALVRAYLDRIEAYDKNGPKINSVITINPKALEEADALDAAYKRSGPVGPLHGIPVVLKDQMDVAGLPTTLGSVVFKDVVPTRDAFVTDEAEEGRRHRHRQGDAGRDGRRRLATARSSASRAIPTTRSARSADRPAAPAPRSPRTSPPSASARKGSPRFAGPRRGTASSACGRRPGLVSRTGVWAGWPSRRGSLGPMTRTVTDMAKLLDVMVGYDPDDPVTALGVGHAPKTYTDVRSIGTASRARASASCASRWATRPSRTPRTSRPSPPMFDKAVAELKAAGAVVVDPIVIPRLNELLARRGAGDGEAVGDGAAVYFARQPQPQVQDDGRGPQLARLRQGDAPPVGGRTAGPGPVRGRRRATS